MQPDPKVPPFEDSSKDGGAPPPLPLSEPPVISAPPPLAAAAPPPLPANSNRKPVSARNLVAILLSLCLGLFLADAALSLADDSLILLFDVHLLSLIRGLVGAFAMLMLIAIYGLMGLTPMVPKRMFLPLPLFILAAQLLMVPFAIYAFAHLQQVAWGISLCQVILGLGILYWVCGLKFRWPLVKEDQLAVRGFSWRNLSVFLLANVFVLLPAVMAYSVVCAALTVDHFTGGFMAVRPGGLIVRVRTYVGPDGKTIQLFPMTHSADTVFYGDVSRSFPTNAIVLMEGVSDNKNLITNKVTYKRLATALGLGEQHEDFKPSRGTLVRADVDVEQFSTNTLDLLNLAMLIHAKGLKAAPLEKLIRTSEPPQLLTQLLDDLLRKRNQHLLEEIHARLAQSDKIIVPWGAAHMPGIAKGIQESGFRLEETRDYVAIRFRFGGKASAKPE
jgi:hypothetical protein